MKLRGLSIWGDSIAKGVVFDEARGRYAVCRDNCVTRLSREAGVEVENFSVMGNTTEQGLRRMESQTLKPSSAGTTAIWTGRPSARTRRSSSAAACRWRSLAKTSARWCAARARAA